jgi:hypothetical protein
MELKIFYYFLLILGGLIFIGVISMFSMMQPDRYYSTQEYNQLPAYSGYEEPKAAAIQHYEEKRDEAVQTTLQSTLPAESNQINTTTLSGYTKGPISASWFVPIDDNGLPNFVFLFISMGLYMGVYMGWFGRAFRGGRNNVFSAIIFTAGIMFAFWLMAKILGWS